MAADLSMAIITAVALITVATLAIALTTMADLNLLSATAFVDLMTCLNLK